MLEEEPQTRDPEQVIDSFPGTVEEPRNYVDDDDCRGQNKRLLLSCGSEINLNGTLWSVWGSPRVPLDYYDWGLIRALAKCIITSARTAMDRVLGRFVEWKRRFHALFREIEKTRPSSTRRRFNTEGGGGTDHFVTRSVTVQIPFLPLSLSCVAVFDRFIKNGNPG